MESSIMKNASRFLREQKKKKRWQKVLLCLALVVAAGTMIALIMPGQALTGTELVLDCQIEAPHQHTADCYAEDGSLICGLADYVAHAHNELCYNEEGELVCKLPEIEGHVHTDDCYAEELVLTCGLEETGADGEGTLAGTADPEGEGSPVSGGDAEASADSSLAPEEQTGHVHTDDCYTTVRKLICGQLETVEHVHGDACFKEVGIEGNEGDMLEGEPEQEDLDVSAGDLNLDALKDEWYFCGRKAHTHSAACRDEEGNLVCGLEEHEHTEECLKEVIYGCGLEAHTHSYSCYDSEDNLICGMQEHEHGEECIIRYWCGHVTHTHNDACYAGVDVTSGDSAATLNCGLEEHEHTDECLIAPILERVYEDDSIKVTATYPASAMIPEEAEFRVLQITREDDPEHYIQRRAEAMEALGDPDWIPVALLNIGFFMEDGTEVVPKESVEVTMQFLDTEGLPIGEPLIMVHFAESGTEILNTTQFDESGSSTFVTDEFSDFMPMSGWDRPAPIDAQDTDFVHNKYIDYLGDKEKGGNNGDTSLTGEDMYRLYLDMEGRSEAVDLLIVIDRSASMNSGDTEKADQVIEKRDKNGKVSYTYVYNEDNETRSDRQLYKLLYGGDEDQNALIRTFLESNPQNRVSVVWFAGLLYNRAANGGTSPFNNSYEKRLPTDPLEGGVIQEWTNTYQHLEFNSIRSVSQFNTGRENFPTLGNVGKDQGITNYAAGYFQADMMLKKAKDSTNKKVVIFLSDGLPTVWYDSDEANMQPAWWDEYEAKTTTFGDEVVWYKRGSGAESTIVKPGESGGTYKYIDQNEKLFDQFVDRNPNIDFFPIGFKMSGTNGKGIKRTVVLEHMAEKYKANGSKLFGAESQDDLAEALRTIMFPSSVTITDKLSAYVELAEDQPDIKVIATPKEGNGQSYVYWDNSKTEIGAGVIDYVTYDKNTKTITAKFCDDYALNAAYTYTLSFNVRLTDYAFDQYAETSKNGTENYGTWGDLTTDYNATVNRQALSDNTTSSNNPGFKSNEEATVTYKVDGKDGSLSYRDPVVQPWKTILQVKKVDEEGKAVTDAEFMLKLGESIVNPFGYTKGSAEGYYKPDTNGMIAYNNLKTGTYTLREKVPEGFDGAGTYKSLTFTVSRGRITGITDTTNATDGFKNVQGFENGDFSAVIQDIASGDHSHGMPDYHKNQKCTLTITNKHKNVPLIVEKVDKNGDGLVGAKFTLSRLGKDGTTLDKVATGEVKPDSKDGLVTWIDKGGAVLEDTTKYYLEPGYIYCLEETKAPDDYVLPENPRVYFKVGYENGEPVVTNEPREGANGDLWYESPKVMKDSSDETITVKVKIKNSAPNISLDLTKLGANLKPLAGARFELFRREKDGDEFGEADKVAVAESRVTTEVGGKITGSMVWTLEENAQGCLVDEMTGKITLPEGLYYLKEVTAPDGHQLLQEGIKFTVELQKEGTQNNGVLRLKKESEVPANAGKGYTIDSLEKDGKITIAITVFNEPNPIQIQIKKLGSSGTPENVPLADAKFYLYSLSSEDYNKESYGSPYDLNTMTQIEGFGLLASNQDGMISLGDLPYGWYCLQEVAAPEGYNKLEEEIIFRVYPNPEATGEKADWKLVAFDKNANYAHSQIVEYGGTDGSNSVFEITIINNMGALLPETGGNGICQYILGGLTLLLMAMITLIYKKKLYN